MVTCVPPVCGPDFGESDFTVGSADLYSNSVFELVAEVPAAVVTVTSSVPVPAGAFTTSLVEDCDSIVAFFVPKCTEVAGERRSPWIATFVPPPVGPEAGSSFSISGLVVSGVAASAGGASALANADAPAKDNPAATSPCINVRRLMLPVAKLRASSSSGMCVPLDLCSHRVPPRQQTLADKVALAALDVCKIFGGGGAGRIARARRPHRGDERTCDPSSRQPWRP
jgi:hypothetical protein